ncbi:MAG: translation initiation factor IF-2 [Actinobacteria bacterium]|nr:translation initiation factor IF-2 [Actinomycetota bacterium]
MTNAEIIDLSGKLGIGVKGPSSTIIDAQADRIRSRAEREGLIRESQPEEVSTKPVRKAAAKKVDGTTVKKAVAKKTAGTGVAAKKAAAKKESATEPQVESTEVAVETPATPRETEVVASRVVSSAQPNQTSPTARSATQPVRQIQPLQPEPVRQPVVTPQPATQITPQQPATQQPAQAPAASTAPTTTQPTQPTQPNRVGGATVPGRPTLPGSTRPIPPPPGSSRPIPPPPIARRPEGGVTRPPFNRSAPRSTAPSTNARTGRIPASQLGRGPAGSGGRTTPDRSAPGRGPAGAGGRPGAPTGGRGTALGRSSPSGPGGRPAPGRGPGGQRRSPRKKTRGQRRQEFEEQLPQTPTSYTASASPVPEGIIVIERGGSSQEFAPKLNRTPADVVRFLLEHGEMVTATMTLVDEQMELFALECGAEILLVDPGQQEELELQAMFDDTDDDDPETQVTRPPIITIMGHVDHGKTTLLDKIRKANVVAGEAGGITQHIGAYQVEKDGKLITFIDTPGHAAFTKMRARGAGVTDIVVLVVAADDGVMPQTIEAINHARVAGVPIVVALNKIDKDNADVQRVLAGLAEQQLTPEAWGGDTIVVEMSAQSGLGIDDLLDQLNAVAELEELTANPTGRAKGVVLEAQLDIGRGPVATIMVDKGMLKVGDPIVAGAAWGKVRAIINDRGEQIKQAGPSTPVQVLGLSAVPGAGEEFRSAPDERTARTVAGAREQRYRTMNQRGDARVQRGVKLEDIFTQIQAGEVATLNVIVKADVHGSLEAVTESLRKLERDDVRAAFVHRGVGTITENDISLAAATNATLIGFNVRPDRKIRELAEKENVEIRTYEIIYKLLEDVEKAMKGMLAPEFIEVVTGEAEVREVFKAPKVGAVAGCSVTSGVITRGSKVRFLREGTIIWKGNINTLRRFKDDVREVREGFECGLSLTDFQDLKPGDVIETYELKEVERA